MRQSCPRSPPGPTSPRPPLTRPTTPPSFRRCIAVNVVCRGRSAHIFGGAAADVLNGTPQEDVIGGGGGDDTLRGRGGNDLLCGGGGSDTLDGGAGNTDVCDGGPAADTFLASCEQRFGEP
ncbi:MAG: hypothetical protein WEB00_08600 [Dehalococcoidia bacterium]